MCIRDRYKRWCAFGLMSTHSRLHGSGSYRVPWLFDDEACDVVKFFTNLKCSLMPYIFQKSVEAHEEGTPVMRPMVFEFMNDPAVPYLDQQYMLGDALMAVSYTHLVISIVTVITFVNYNSTTIYFGSMSLTIPKVVYIIPVSYTHLSRSSRTCRTV